MSIKLHPVLIAAAIGFVIQILLIFATDIPVIAMASPEETVNPISIVIGCLTSLLSLVSPLGVGMIYPFLAKGQEPLIIPSSALGGALSVLLASILGTIFLLSFRWLIIPVIFDLINPTISFETVQQVLGMNLMSRVALFSLFIVGWIINSVIGAVGGTIGALLINRGQQKS